MRLILLFILARLESTGQAKNTIVVLRGDHGWNLGEHGIWGKHNLYETALRSPLIIKLTKIKRTGKPMNAIVETAIIFPTLGELVDLPEPVREEENIAGRWPDLVAESGFRLSEKQAVHNQRK